MRIEGSLRQRNAASAPAAETAPTSDMAAFIADVEQPKPAPRPRVDSMPGNPVEDAPLVAPAFPEPTGPDASAHDAKNGPRKRHPGLEDTAAPMSQADARPAAPTPPPGFEPARIALPPAPQPSINFTDVPAADVPAH